MAGRIAARAGRLASLALCLGCASAPAWAAAGRVADEAIEYASLRAGRAVYWQAPGNTPTQPATALPTSLETPLGSVWKLFVHAYLADRGIEPADYVCGGRDREEVYCCEPGAAIGREAALLRSCGLYFAPARLGLSGDDWASYWQARAAPAWLSQLDQLRPDTQVSVDSLLRALDSVPESARRQTGGTLLASVLANRDPDLTRQFGGLLRAKTFSWHLAEPGEPRIGGAAGWLADGSPIWLAGRGTSRTVLARAAQRLPTQFTEAGDADGGCVEVAMFERYPLAGVATADAQPAPAGALHGQFIASFGNGNQFGFASAGEMRLVPGTPPRLVARLSVNEYVARVVEREAAAEPVAAARALAVAARSYLMQTARRDGACLGIADSSASQRVLASPASAAARRVATWTDSLILAGVPVHYHLDQPGPNRLAWRQAVEWARAGDDFDAILLRVWPDASLTSTDSPLASDCPRLPAAERWLAQQAARWRPRLAGEAGFEAPPAPAVCRLTQGNPYADTHRGRIHVHGLDGREDRLALAHEYLHLAFAQHPRGGDESYIESLARRLLMETMP